MPGTITINNRRIGKGCPVYIVAEISANHNQDFGRAAGLVRAAKGAGADAVKFQTFTPDTITLDCNNDCFRIGKGTAWEGRTLYDLYREASMPWEWQPELKKIADSLGLDCFSTPFDPTSAEFLETTGVPAYKVASFEIVDIPLIRTIARTKKPVIISTGMASAAEIDDAVRAVRSEGNDQVALLKCTSAYPAPPEEANLATIPHMAETFGVPVGISDHTMAVAVPVAAVALGACIVEKHLTLSRGDPGPASAFPLPPREFAEMAAAVRQTEKAIGNVTYAVTEHEKAGRVFRRSLFVVRDMKAGEEFTGSNVRSIRPGYGLPPKQYAAVLGKKANRDISAGTPLSWELIG